MNYGYIRLSSDKQTGENWRIEINKFCELDKVDYIEFIYLNEKEQRKDIDELWEIRQKRKGH